MKRILFIFSIFSQTLFCMDNKSDLCSLPVPIRHNILVLLMQEHDTYQETKNLLMSLALVSKKSYEQVNCINFTKGIVAFLSQDHEESREEIAHNIGIMGMKKYVKLGRKLLITIDEKDPIEPKRTVVQRLLNRGTDINFQGEGKITPLMKATEQSEKQIVYFLTKEGADVTAVGAKGPVREYSPLFEPALLDKRLKIERHLLFLVKIRERRQNENIASKLINRVLYSHKFGTKIRHAIMIDQYLEACGGKSEYALIPFLKNVCERVPNSEPIIHIVTDINNNPILPLSMVDKI